MAHGAKDCSNVLMPTQAYRLDDLGELAVRLGSIVTYNRAGMVLLLDGFETGLNAWTIGTYGVGSSVVLTSDKAYNGGACVLMDSGTGANPIAQMIRFTPVRVPTRMGFQVFFSPDNDLYTMGIGIISNRIPTARTFLVEYKHSTGELLYYRPGPGWTVFASMGEQYFDNDDWHNIKMIIDTETGEYVRCYFDDKVYDMSGFLPYTEDWARGPMEYIVLTTWGTALLAGVNYVDNVVVTFNEP